MKSLLIVTAVLEAATGVALLAAPALIVSILLASALDAPASIFAARLAGAALLSLGIACWLASRDTKSRAGRGVVTAMLSYNVLAVALLVYAGLGAGMAGIGLWPAVLVHLGLAAWCATGLLRQDLS